MICGSKFSGGDCFVLCVSGGEGAGSAWDELIHTSPHTGLLGAGWSGPAARPWEALRDDPEEEEDAPTQQKEEMRRTAVLQKIEETFWTTTCRGPSQQTCLWHLENFSGWNQRKAWQTSWGVGNQLWLWSLCQMIPPFFSDMMAHLLPWEPFLPLSTHSSPHLPPAKEQRRTSYMSRGNDRGKPVQYTMNVHRCNHSNIEGYLYHYLYKL